ncbi:unnamed protein product [Amoebophrya sp. A25]|nr:unnamed protein product [Amoebophrya sp. A25]|eukprot:GSA25T00001754001.1
MLSDKGYDLVSNVGGDNVCLLRERYVKTVLARNRQKAHPRETRRNASANAEPILRSLLQDYRGLVDEFDCYRQLRYQSQPFLYQDAADWGYSYEDYRSDVSRLRNWKPNVHIHAARLVLILRCRNRVSACLR